MLATLRANKNEQGSRRNIDKGSESYSGGEKSEDDKDDEDLDCSMSGVLQRLAYVLAQQGKEEETIAINEELAIEQAIGRRPCLWEGIE
jgi:hypothetical protein